MPPGVVLALWFAAGLGITLISGALLQTAHTKRPSHQDAAQAIEVRIR